MRMLAATTLVERVVRLRREGHRFRRQQVNPD
jgi:hypothetical protein